MGMEVHESQKLQRAFFLTFIEVVLVPLSLTLNFFTPYFSVSIIDFEQVTVGCVIETIFAMLH